MHYQYCVESRSLQYFVFNALHFLESVIWHLPAEMFILLLAMQRDIGFRCVFTQLLTDLPSWAKDLKHTMSTSNNLMEFVTDHMICGASLRYSQILFIHSNLLNGYEVLRCLAVELLEFCKTMVSRFASQYKRSWYNTNRKE